MLSRPYRPVHRTSREVVTIVHYSAIPSYHAVTVRESNSSWGLPEDASTVGPMYYIE